MASFTSLSLLGLSMFRSQNSLSGQTVQVVNTPAEYPSTVDDRTSVSDVMEVDVSNTPAAPAAHGVDARSGATSNDASRQSKRPATSESDVTDRDGDERSSKRLRQNSTSTESPSSSVPPERHPIFASYCSQQRYRTRVTDFCIFPGFENIIMIL